MTTIGMLLGISNLAVALVCIGFCLPLLRGRIKPNPSYGFRLGKALASESAWTAINRYGARRMILWCVPLGLLGLVTFFLPLGGQDNVLILAIANAPLILLIPTIECWRFARNYHDPE